MRKVKLLVALLTIGCVQAGFAQCGSDPVSGLVTIAAANQIVNSYFPGLGNPTAGSMSLSVGSIDARGSATTLSAGDLVVIIQMQGADMDVTNTDAYGDGVSGSPASGYLTSNLYAGNFEYNTVASFGSGTITFSYALTRNYYTQSFTSSNPIRTYQVIRVPRYYDLTINAGASITTPAWNGSTGGIVILDAANTLTLNGSVSVAGLGFRGGGGKNFLGGTAGNSNGSTTLNNTDYRWESPITNPANETGGAKGEGIAGTPAYVLPQGATTTITNSVEGYLSGSMGRGAPGNAGGGGTDARPLNGNAYNTGGGGGGNAGAGGQGGSGWNGGAGDYTFNPYGGHGGSVFAQSSINKIVMGGGGGAGVANNSDGTNEYQSSGGSGGGIIITRAKLYAGSGSFSADGGDAPGVVGVGGTTNTDAPGGGGAGGTLIAVTRLSGATGLGSVTASAKGGKGGDMTNYYDHGPGGGGGGGYIYSNGTFASTNVTLGANGKTRSVNEFGAVDNDYGATPGANGQVITLGAAPNLVPSPCGILPVSIVKFNGVVKANNVSLTWQVDGAVAFHHFEVENSLNGSTFSLAGKIGYQQNQNSYEFLHSNITSPVVYYRLKLVDVNGSYAYSKTISVRLGRDNSKVLLFPNPAAERATLQFAWVSAAQATVSVLDQSGRLVDQKTFTVQNGDNFIPIETEKMTTGSYLVQVHINDKIVVVQKLQVTKSK
jgi:hypothetical protein